jgi:hypothetical protein
LIYFFCAAWFGFELKQSAKRHLLAPVYYKPNAKLRAGLAHFLSHY